MLYGIKTALMKKVIAKRQKDKPFDYELGEAYAIPPSAAPTVNNSYYFSAHDPASDTSLYCRLGLRSCHAEVWMLYAEGGRRYRHTTLLHKDACPLTVTRCEEGWQIAFRGPLTAEDGSEVRATLAATFTSDTPAVDFFSHMPPVCTARAMAAEKWSREFFAEVQKNNQVHYEQYGRLSGRITLDDCERPFSLPAVRDHSFGTRVWDYMNNHVWLLALNEEAALNFSMVSYPAISVLEVGNWKCAEAPMAYILSAEYDRAAVVAGAIPKTLPLTIRLADGRCLSLTAELEFFDEYLFEEGAYRLSEGVGSFLIDGVRYRGIIEMGWNRNTDRHFNGKSIKELKV